MNRAIRWGAGRVGRHQVLVLDSRDLATDALVGLLARGRQSGDLRRAVRALGV
ncbi:hypothetical protein [Streptomyces sp. NPDC015242]|uniref:hypothetical protein n=1 Tax=Streptomyces sp. NPDC015242 TaxID=3364951 RepID=UPI0036FFB7FB